MSSLPAKIAVVISFVFLISASAVGASAASKPSATRTISAPTGLKIQVQDQTWFVMQWTPTTAVSGYRLYLNGVQQATTTQPAYNYSYLKCGTTYSLGVAGYTKSATSPIATLKATTSPCTPVADTSAPSAPTGLTATSATTTAATLAWTASTDNVGVTGYTVLLNGQQAAQTTGLGATLSGLTCSTTYSVAVNAVDAAGNKSAPSALTLVTASCPPPVPPAPTSLFIQGTAQAQTWFVMQWTPSAGATGYQLYLNGTPQATTTNFWYAFSYLTCGTPYTLGVAASNSTGASPVSTLLAATLPCAAAPDTTAPSAPTGLTATSATATGATIAWKASTDDVGVTGYNVLLNGQQVAQTAGLSATLGGLACSTSYATAVDAFDAAGNVSPQSQVTVVTAACINQAPPPPASGFWSAASFLNTPISGFTTSPSSASWLNLLSGSETYGLWVDNQSWAAPIYHATSSTPTVTIAVNNTGKHITIPYQASFQPDPSSDSQLAVINDSNGCEYEFQAFNPSTLSAHSEGTFHAFTGSGMHANDAGVTGSNISVLGGLITAKDVASGAINHALRYATPVDSSGFVAPATRSDGGTSGGIPAGELMRLDPALNLSGLGLTPFQLMVAKALQQYGAYNADASGSFKIYAESTVDGATYSTAISALPWSVVSHLQFGSAALGSTAVDTNSDPSCNEQH